MFTKRQTHKTFSYNKLIDFWESLVTRHDSPVARQVPFFQFLEHRGGTDVQDTGSIANAAGVQRHIDDLLLDRR
jgi:hypothetical protein